MLSPPGFTIEGCTCGLHEAGYPPGEIYQESTPLRLFSPVHVHDCKPCTLPIPCVHIKRFRRRSRTQKGQETVKRPVSQSCPSRRFRPSNGLSPIPPVEKLPPKCVETLTSLLFQQYGKSTPTIVFFFETCRRCFAVKAVCQRVSLDRVCAAVKMLSLVISYKHRAH